MALVGEFNNWEPKDGHWAFKNEYGVWELFLPDNPDGSQAIPHRYFMICCHFRYMPHFLHNVQFGLCTSTSHLLLM
jgi:hypothetical protein